ncbi:MAG: hypothetical protein HY302_13355 [Opitutae bacterium]|nr:hypothetical protein [Opitutae bacterium]
MKFVFLAGGFAGFLLTAIAGYLADRSVNNIILDAAIGCLVGAVLFRWFWSVALNSMQETVELKARADAATAAAAAPSHPAQHR